MRDYPVERDYLMGQPKEAKPIEKQMKEAIRELQDERSYHALSLNVIDTKLEKLIKLDLNLKKEYGI